jgi:hypothetical protein
LRDDHREPLGDGYPPTGGFAQSLNHFVPNLFLLRKVISVILSEAKDLKKARFFASLRMTSSRWHFPQQELINKTAISDCHGDDIDDPKRKKHSAWKTNVLGLVRNFVRGRLDTIKNRLQGDSPRFIGRWITCTGVRPMRTCNVAFERPVRVRSERSCSIQEVRHSCLTEKDRQECLSS